ncbi:low molecular weight phosphotyrosine protein phosphatase [Virgibacillus salarius]|uniref:low molecular weight protein-tyrosine-phosphatase n=1 Tax=Virgibacillus salarius TaxID=447199 RepID=UPI0024915C06|nr:low molecular weight protein-tyrosine-phosphatase [Virgibacillus salarius]WBX80381.1 low molecular weight phosphotyrosine protein phosphatase [Virgibacillus salarius]
MIRVMFVCLGNICRSPMAEAIFRELIKQANLTDQIRVDSGGTGSWHIGEEPHHETKLILQRNNISSDGLIARQINADDAKRFDYIIAMDDQNKEDLLQLVGQKDKVMIAKLMDFVSDPEENSIPDPYFTGNFDYTYRLVSTGCRQLLEYLKEEHAIS